MSRTTANSIQTGCAEELARRAMAGEGERDGWKNSPYQKGGAREGFNSVNLAPMPREGPIHKDAAAHDILLGHGAPIPAVSTVVAVVPERKVVFCWHWKRLVATSE